MLTSFLNPESAKHIFDVCSEKLRKPEFSARGLMKHYNVEVICTTDDPIDSLGITLHLQKGLRDKGVTHLAPCKAMAVNATEYRKYIEKLSEVSGWR